MVDNVFHHQVKPHDMWTIEKKTKNPHPTQADQAWLYQIKKGNESGDKMKKEYGYFSKPDRSLCEERPGFWFKGVYFDPDLTLDAQYWKVHPLDQGAQIRCVYWRDSDSKTGGFQQPCNPDGTCIEGLTCSKRSNICLKGPGGYCDNNDQCTSGICTNDRCNFERSNNLIIYIVVILIILSIVYFIIIYKKNNIKNDVT